MLYYLGVKLSDKLNYSISVSIICKKNFCVLGIVKCNFWYCLLKVKVRVYGLEYGLI